MWRSSIFRSGAVALAVAFLVACSPPDPPGPPTVTVTPLCAILCVNFTAEQNLISGMIFKRADALVAERIDPSSPHGFTRFRRLQRQLGNPAAGSMSADVYGISEAWLRSSPLAVVRADAHPASRPAFNDFEGSAWSIRSQGPTGSWSPVFARGTANPGDEQDDRAAAGLTAPQLMEVGNANRQVFACAGGRSADDRVRTTLLLKVNVPTASTTGSTTLVQDLLNGDDRFVPNAPGPLIGPATPPTPTISNLPGHNLSDGSVQCAMRQLGDDVTTRELHMVTVRNGVLYHSMASTFSAATTGNGFTFNRFNTVTPWTDIRLGVGSLGNIISAAIVASRPTAVSVFIVAESGGRYRLYHAVRFSPSGSWRPVDDVLALNGASLNGLSFPFNVAAGVCPVLGRTQDSELVYAIWDADGFIHVGRVLSTPRVWEPGVVGVYSPLSQVARFAPLTTNRGWSETRSTIQSLSVAARPFSDQARPTP